MMSSPPPSLTSPPWSGRTKRTVALIVIGLILFSFLKLLDAWTIVIIALILAYLLNPIVNVFDQHALTFIPFNGLRRSLAVLLTFALLILAITLGIIVIVPPLVSQTQDFLEELPDLVASYEEQLERSLSRPISVGNTKIIPWEELRGVLGGDEDPENQVDLSNTVRDAITTLSEPVVNVATFAISFVFSFFLMLVIMFYLMKDGPAFIHKIDHAIPIEYQGDVRRLIYELGLIWDAYLRGQLLLGIIVGVETGLAAAILGLPQPLVLGLLAGFLEFIPNIGPILSSIPAILFALISPSTTIPGLEGVPFALIVAAVYIFIQQSEALFLIPRIMGHSLDLHPVAILIAVISGAALAGLLGIVLAAPVLATIRLLLIYIWGKLLDYDPFAQPAPMPMNVPTSPFETYLAPTRPPALSSPFLPEQSGEIVDDDFLL